MILNYKKQNDSITLINQNIRTDPKPNKIQNYFGYQSVLNFVSQAEPKPKLNEPKSN